MVASKFADSKWVKRFDAMTLRERVLSAGVLAVLTAILWYEFLFTPLAEKIDNSEDRIAELKIKLNTEQLKEKGFERILSVKQKTSEEESHQKYLALLKKLKTEIKEKTLKVVNAAQMVSVLKDLLVHNQGLELLNMHNLPAKLIQKRGEKAIIEKQGGFEKHELNKLYLQSVKMEMIGSFDDLIQYLLALEQLRWKFIWSELQIESGNYPQIEISLTVSTLSLDKNLFGFEQ